MYVVGTMKSPFTTDQDYEYAMRKLGQCVGDVLTNKDVRRATVFISPKLTIKATAQRRQDSRDGSATCLVTVGKPNFLERRHIAVCKKEGKTFPIDVVQWKLWPKKATVKRRKRARQGAGSQAD